MEINSQPRSYLVKIAFLGDVESGHMRFAVD